MERLISHAGRHRDGGHAARVDSEITQSAKKKKKNTRP